MSVMISLLMRSRLYESKNKLRFHDKIGKEILREIRGQELISIVLRVSRIEMAWVNANWVYRLDCGHLVNDPIDFIVK